MGCIVHVRYYGELLRFFLREVKNLDEAQDLVQEACERGLAMASTGERIDDPRALHYKIARHLLIDRHRARQVRNHESDAVLQDMAGPLSDDPEAAYAGRQRGRLLVATIERLPPRCREAFVLHKIDGLSHAEVAARMGVGINAVERHVMLAVAACRKALGDDPRRTRTQPPSRMPSGLPTEPAVSLPQGG
nr:RNA polymerase sigma factor [Cupriavidus basilensis]